LARPAATLDAAKINAGRTHPRFPSFHDPERAIP
jgi:hypothetical protein